MTPTDTMPEDLMGALEDCAKNVSHEASVIADLKNLYTQGSEEIDHYTLKTLVKYASRYQSLLAVAESLAADLTELSDPVIPPESLQSFREFKEKA